MNYKQIKQSQEEKGRKEYGDQLDAVDGINRRLKTEQDKVRNGLEEVADAINYFEALTISTNDLMIKYKANRTLYYLIKSFMEWEDN